MSLLQHSWQNAPGSPQAQHRTEENQLGWCWKSGWDSQIFMVSVWPASFLFATQKHQHADTVSQEKKNPEDNLVKIQQHNSWIWVGVMQAESSSPVIMKEQVWLDPLFEYFQRFLKSTLTSIFTLWVELSWLGHSEHQKNWHLQVCRSCVSCC